MGILERIKEIEEEMARTQKNKATEYHLGLLKSRLARLRSQLLEGPKGQGKSDEKGFEVVKYGDARVALIGFPSVGKSTLLSMLTKTKSETAAYEFTTLTTIPGILEYRDAKIQLLDLPGIIEGASQGKGRGRQAEEQRILLERELETVGIRLNKRPPNVYFAKKNTGGILFTATVPLTRMNEKMAYMILHEYRIHNAEILIREDITVDEFIDVVEGNRQYIRCLYVYNKIDSTTIEHVDRLARMDNSVVVSCELELNLDYLVEKIWEYLQLIRVYTKRQGNPPDLKEPLILREDSTVEDACKAIHRSLADPTQFRYALVWGRSAKHDPQRVGLTHPLLDEDVLQVVKK
ncbi:GTP-binding protein isoform 2 [Galdieria sulphuraria]|uniref:GTP-binding protein isoform 2 n=1 Tax=Galdieria sulphuraria TaxID=130081 RepID=M2XIQ1_GALSU|nr:GTP-binding protein isoform 2 [Galdieria sulphuraria]EME29972.1 GTP-binding protein isoform 2 [Galdieria sulphuraria]|eukprot:XP_005706492.1 GTP-binding protein isoform 2 [Galdieria sulphuraria]